MEQILWTSLSQEFRVKLKMAEEDAPWSFLDILRSPGSLESRSLEQLGLRLEEILDVQPDELLIPGTQRKPVKRGTAVSMTNTDRHGDYPSARSSAPVLTENQDFASLALMLHGTPPLVTPALSTQVQLFQQRPSLTPFATCNRSIISEKTKGSSRTATFSSTPDGAAIVTSQRGPTWRSCCALPLHWHSRPRAFRGFRRDCNLMASLSKGLEIDTSIFRTQG